jgi:TPR repeat protein
VRIFYDYVPDKAAKVINEASELLTTDCIDCHREALRLLLTVRNDERAQNALGVAYWLCGQQQEAIECFRRAAANGNADAKENLEKLTTEH